ncbi:hypothetical protein D9M73_114120 [compost metagenome]
MAAMIFRACALFLLVGMSYAAPGNYSGEVESEGGGGLYWLNFIWIAAVAAYFYFRDK